MQRLDLHERPSTPLAVSLPRLESLLSPYVGIAQATVEVLRAPDEARLVTVACALADGRQIIGADTVEHTGGSHVTRAAALAAALGEAAERYSAAYFPEERSIQATARELGEAAVDPERFALFHDRQYADPGFPFVRFDRDTRLRWVEGWSLPDGEPILLPAQLVYLQRPASDEPAIAYATSNGVACGPTREEAILGALCEAAERDAFMLVWRNRLSLRRLSWAESRTLRDLDRRFFAPTGLRYTAVDLSGFLGIPTVLGVVRTRADHSGPFGVGAGCSPTVEEAWRKALSEAFSVYRWMGERSSSATLPSDAEAVRTFDDHLLFYAEPARAERTSFLDASPECVDVAAVRPLDGGDVGAQIREAVARLRERAISAYAVDVTAPDIREAGLCVMRFVGPELCSLDVAHSARFLGGVRLLRAAYEAGLLPAPLTIADLNPDPHPFP